MTQESSSEQTEVKMNHAKSNLVHQRCASSDHTFIKNKIDKYK